MTAISALRGTITTRRSARSARRRLERELASFSTPSQRLEIAAMLTRHPAVETREIREILDAQDRSRATNAPLIRGGHLGG